MDLTSGRDFPRGISHYSRAVRDDDNTLLLACRKGDPASWEKLVFRYERLAFSIPLSYGLSREDASDIVQIAFTILFQSLDSLDDDSNLRAWLATVVRRHTWRRLERNRREAPAKGVDLAESPNRLGKDESNPIERWVLVEWLEDGLSRMDERCRALLMALYFDSDEPSYEEVSDRLGMALGSIGPTRARCLKRLKALLESR